MKDSTKRRCSRHVWNYQWNTGRRKLLKIRMNNPLFKMNTNVVAIWWLKDKEEIALWLGSYLMILLFILSIYTWAQSYNRYRNVVIPIELKDNTKLSDEKDKESLSCKVGIWRLQQSTLRHTITKETIAKFTQFLICSRGNVMSILLSNF